MTPNGFPVVPRAVDRQERGSGSRGGRVGVTARTAFADMEGRITATIGAQYEEGDRPHTVIGENLARLGYRVGRENAP